MYEAKLIKLFTCTPRDRYVNLAIFMQCCMPRLLSECIVELSRACYCHSFYVASIIPPKMFHESCHSAANLAAAFEFDLSEPNIIEGHVCSLAAVWCTKWLNVSVLLWLKQGLGFASFSRTQWRNERRK